MKAPGRSQGLDALDEARAASLADEGGASAATLEAQRPPSVGLHPQQRALALFCAGAAGLVLATLALRRR